MTIPAGVEDVGENFSVEKILDVRLRTRVAVNEIASRIEVGITGREANKIAGDTLSELGLRKGWHGIYVRSGTDTGRNYNEPEALDTPIAEEDLFLVDIGPIYEDIEGDAGDTFVFGDNPDHLRIKSDVKAIWDDVRDAWFREHLTGRALYQFASQTSEERGWVLSPSLTGHRLSDFPHKAIYTGTLDLVDLVPSPGLWVLEIALVEPGRRFGAFYEDLLLTDQSFDRPEAG
jgi:methionyl aminopeptidase